MAWRVAEEAEHDLEAIAEQGILNFGFSRTQSYIDEFLEAFETLSANPRLAPERQALSSAVRLMPHGAHHILYVIENEDVVVLRILHGLQDWFSLF